MTDCHLARLCTSSHVPRVRALPNPVPPIRARIDGLCVAWPCPYTTIVVVRVRSRQYQRARLVGFEEAREQAVAAPLGNQLAGSLSDTVDPNRVRAEQRQDPARSGDLGNRHASDCRPVAPCGDKTQLTQHKQARRFLLLVLQRETLVALSCLGKLWRSSIGLGLLAFPVTLDLSAPLEPSYIVKT